MAQCVDSVGDGVAHPRKGSEALLDVGQGLRWSDGHARLLEGFAVGHFGAVHREICIATDGDEINCRGRCHLRGCDDDEMGLGDSAPEPEVPRS